MVARAISARLSTRSYGFWLLSGAIALGCSGNRDAARTGMAASPRASGTPPVTGGGMSAGTSGPVPAGSVPGPVRGTALETLASACNSAVGPTPEFAPLARLTRREYQNSVSALTGVTYDASGMTPDGIVGLFYANVGTSVTEAQVDDYRVTAESLAKSATANLATLVACAPADGETCARSFINGFGLRAFRRDLTAQEASEYLDVYRVGTGRDGFRGGIRLVLSAILQSPLFLYRVELSPRANVGPSQLSPFETATRLSYLLTSAPPDGELLNVAATGALSNPDTLAEQARRVLKTEASMKALGDFHGEWLKLGEITVTEKDATTFPNFTAAVRAGMARESADFTSYVLDQGDGKFSTLLTAPYSVIDPVLAPLYGVAPPAGVARVDFNPAERSGLLTQGAFLSVKAHSKQTSPVRRGIGFLQSLVCINMPPPPANVMPVSPEVRAGATTRELFAAHSANPACSGCHSIIDPPGLGFEIYDAVGAYRKSENGFPLETAVELTGVAPGVDGRYLDLPTLLKAVAASQSASDCYATQWFRFAMKRDPSSTDGCSLKSMRDALQRSDGAVHELVLAVATSDAFRYGTREAD